MPIFIYWGSDDYAIHRSALTLRSHTVEPEWLAFNYSVYSHDNLNAALEALEAALSPPLGGSSRMVWLANTTLLSQCPPPLLEKLQQTIERLPSTTVLLLTCTKIDRRLKSSQLLLARARVQEFSLIPGWRTEDLRQPVLDVAAQVGVPLTPSAVSVLAEAVSNDTRALYAELEKLKTYAAQSEQPLGEKVVRELVTSNTTTSLQLANAIRTGKTSQTLTLLNDLFNRNEPPLKIIATLVTQFRTWLWVKLMVVEGERDINAIATAASVGNPKRVYVLQKEVRPLSLKKLQHTLPFLLDLEAALKQGNPELMTLQTRIIVLSQLYAKA
jgi:DNA polymerase-3 subunit delta